MLRVEELEHFHLLGCVLHWIVELDLLLFLGSLVFAFLSFLLVGSIDKFDVIRRHLFVALVWLDSSYDFVHHFVDNLRHVVLDVVKDLTSSLVL